MSSFIKETEIQENRVVLVVPKQHVKTVKTVLERHGKLDRSQKIVAEACGHFDNKFDRMATLETAQSGPDASKASRMRISTTIPYPLDKESMKESALDRFLTPEILQDAAFLHIAKEIRISFTTLPSTPSAPTQKNPLHKALAQALDALAPLILADLNLTTSTLISAFPEGYSIYPPLLLLPHNALASPVWQTLMASDPSFRAVWTHVAAKLGVTHIAINSPIPLQASNPADENILRSPVHMTPLHASFGPSPTPQTLTSPTPADFTSALWVRTTQNGIHQTWAPMYTMFSRGNIREKTRVLHFPDVRGSAVVDMYAGIGYFTFSYKKAGCSLVVCFELNPWSVEGLRRGAEMNGWTCRIVRRGEEWDGETGGVDFLIFEMSNADASAVVSRLRNSPRVGHVNLGLLPTSRDTWRDAVGLVDGQHGGWIHAHENVGVVEMEERKGEAQGVFQGYAGERRKAKIQHVERVKMYAPGVVHCVFDVWVDGTEHQEAE
jgi:tRNA wybutosine-synthesizing protein 2